MNSPITQTPNIIEILRAVPPGQVALLVFAGIVTYIGSSLLKDLIRMKVSSHTSPGGCTADPKHFERLKEIHSVVMSTDGDGNHLALFPRNQVIRHHERQDRILAEIAKTQETMARVLDSLQKQQEKHNDKIEETLRELATRECPQGQWRRRPENGAGDGLL